MRKHLIYLCIGIAILSIFCIMGCGPIDDDDDDDDDDVVASIDYKGLPYESPDYVQRFVLTGSKWTEDVLTYSIRSSNETWKSEIKRAFEIWSSVSRLKFVDNGNNSADIELTWVKGFHWDFDPFDGPGNVLAHASPPEVGDIHFDSEENWTTDKVSGIDVFTVALHEIGHSLGLNHEDDINATMYPSYQGVKTGLGVDDIKGINNLYPPGDGGNGDDGDDGDDGGDGDEGDDGDGGDGDGGDDDDGVVVPDETKVVRILATERWTNTWIFLKPGDIVEVTAQEGGRWRRDKGDKNQPWEDADGFPIGIENANPGPPATPGFTCQS